MDASAGTDGFRWGNSKWGDTMALTAAKRKSERFGKARLIKIADALELARRRFLYDVSPGLLVQYLSLKTGGRLFHPGRARTFEDKLRWLMLYWREPLKSQCADKYAVRSYVTERGLGHLLPELLGIYGSSAEIDFSSFPEKFVLKCTHGSGFNLLCRDKARFDVKAGVKMLDRWMKADISKVNGEVHYRPSGLGSSARLSSAIRPPPRSPTTRSIVSTAVPLHDGLHRTGTGDATNQKFDYYDISLGSTNWPIAGRACRPATISPNPKPMRR